MQKAAQLEGLATLAHAKLQSQKQEPGVGLTSRLTESRCAHTRVNCREISGCSEVGLGRRRCEAWTIGSDFGDAEFNSTSQDCAAQRELFEGFCKYFRDVKASCDMFEACWKAAEEHFLETSEMIRHSVSKRKCAYAATKRMICRIDILKNIAISFVRDCTGLDVDTSFLNISIPRNRAKKVSCLLASCHLHPATGLFTMSCGPDECRAVGALASATSPFSKHEQSSAQELRHLFEPQHKCWYSADSADPVHEECPRACFELPEDHSTTQAPSQDSKTTHAPLNSGNRYAGHQSYQGYWSSRWRHRSRWRWHRSSFRRRSPRWRRRPSWKWSWRRLLVQHGQMK